jgi:hypothetical protein
MHVFGKIKNNAGSQSRSAKTAAGSPAMNRQLMGNGKFYNGSDIAASFGVYQAGRLPAVNTGIRGKHIGVEEIRVNVTGNYLPELIKYAAVLIGQI